MAETPSAFSQIEHLLPRSQEAKPICVMTCGIAGSGKSSLAHAIVKKYSNFTRLSIDELIYAKHGVYGVDYDRSNFKRYQEEAEDLLLRRLHELLATRSDVVIDLSFWSKETRDKYKRIIESHDCRWILVYFEATRDVLWKRIQHRKERAVNADSAFEVTEEVLDRYVAGFERPLNEGEVVIRVL